MPPFSKVIPYSPNVENEKLFEKAFAKSEEVIELLGEILQWKNISTLFLRISPGPQQWRRPRHFGMGQRSEKLRNPWGGVSRGKGTPIYFAMPMSVSIRDSNFGTRGLWGRV
jgi:hypothetical protein